MVPNRHGDSATEPLVVEERCLGTQGDTGTGSRKCFLDKRLDIDGVPALGVSEEAVGKELFPYRVEVEAGGAALHVGL